MFLHSCSINSPFIPSLLIHILTPLSSDGKLKVCLVVRGHWINHFKQELCWGFRISSVTYFSFLFSMAFPAFPLLFVKEKISGVRSRVRKCQEMSGLVAQLTGKWVARIPEPGGLAWLPASLRCRLGMQQEQEGVMWALWQRPRWQVSS